MEQDFYVGRLRERFGLKVMIPDSDERKDVHDIIYGELCLGTIRSASQKRYVEIAQNMQARGAQAVILGCTEIGMLLTEEVTDVPLIDTTRVHAQEAIAWMLSESEG
jgi:aspartate racemase